MNYKIVLLGAVLVAAAGCGATHGSAAPTTTKAALTTAPPPSTSTTTVPAADLSIQVCDDFNSFVAILKGNGDFGATAFGQVEGMEQDAAQAVGNGASGKGDVVLVGDLKALAALVDTKAWTGLPAMASSPQVQKVVFDCTLVEHAPLTGG